MLGPTPEERARFQREDQPVWTSDAIKAAHPRDARALAARALSGPERAATLPAVNFFGHAAVASWQTRDPGFVLGSMLPDFATMIRARPPGTRHAELDAGIQFHHLVDDIFHDAPAFRELSRDAFRFLLARGVTRGAARAVAHIGVEILLDGELAHDKSARQAYLGAIDASAETELGRFVEWRDAAERARFAALREGLVSRGIHRDHSSPAVVVHRVARALTGRPRLALDPQHHPMVHEWAAAAQPDVARRAPELFSGIAQALEQHAERRAAAGS